MIIDMASTYITINFKRHQYARCFMLIKLIVEAQKTKMDWLPAQLAVTKSFLMVSGKTVIVIFE